MTKHDLKELAAMGVELGAAKAENERLRGLLTQALEFTEANTCGGPDVAQLIAEMRAALSQQAEPMCDTCHGQGEVWTGENQSFGHMSMQPPEPIMEVCPECGGDCSDANPPVMNCPMQSAQAPAQGEWEAHVSDKVFQDEFMAWWEDHGQFCRAGGGDYERTFAFQAWRHLYPMLMQARAARPAQTEHPVAWLIDWPEEPELGYYFSDGPNEHARSRPLYAAPIAQTAPLPEQSGLVEAAQGALAEIQAALEDAYHNAYPECCRQDHLECCGSPLQAWTEADQKIMERFAPHEKALRAALSAQGAAHE